LLIAVIEAVTGQPLSEAFAELLLQPLNLRRTWVPGDRPIEQVPTPAAFWAGDGVLDRPRCLSSLSDLAGRLLGILDGEGHRWQVPVARPEGRAGIMFNVVRQRA
jgi:CubicO group peptidase (beta-lactamase class C family)